MFKNALKLALLASILHLNSAFAEVNKTNDVNNAIKNVPKHLHDFSLCAQRYEDNTFELKGHRVVPILHNNKTLFVTYSKMPIIDEHVIAVDPFIGLYLIDGDKENSEDKEEKKKGYKLKNIDAFSNTLQLAEIGIKKTQDAQNIQISRGEVTKRQDGFLNYAQFSTNIAPNGIISNICYQIYGITAEDGFIEKAFLERFLSQASKGRDSIYYGDIGVRLDKKNGNKVTQIDPFFPLNPFKTGDAITQINGYDITDPKKIELLIADLDNKTKSKIKIKRNEKEMEFNISPTQKFGGLLVQDTFFERLQIKLDKSLTITRNRYRGQNELRNIRQGDQIIWVDGVNPHQMEGDLFANFRELLSSGFQKKGYIELLLSRNGFQFSLKIYPDDALKIEEPPKPPKKDELILLQEKPRNR
ncbi:MAG: PDZ domain-containing protein [Helicobacter sp.]|nr:PDZ domain-containing protein [Helicobacter sp.]